MGEMQGENVWGKRGRSVRGKWGTFVRGKWGRFVRRKWWRFGQTRPNNLKGCPGWILRKIPSCKNSQGSRAESQPLDLPTKFTMTTEEPTQLSTILLAERPDSVTPKPFQIPPGAAFPNGSELLAGFWGVPHPADVGGHPGLGAQPLHQALKQRGQVDVIDGSLGQHLADPAHGPGCRVPDHHAGILHQLYQRRHGLQRARRNQVR